MSNIKITFEIDENDLVCSTFIPEYLSKQEQTEYAEKFSNILILLQTGNLMAQIMHSVVESGIISDQKPFSNLIIKKMIEAFNVVSDNKPIITPSEAFVFKEKQ
jgi:hypothetical protein